MAHSIIDISHDTARISRFHCQNRFRSDLEFSRKGAVHQDERLEAPAETKREFVQSVVYTCRNTRAATSWPTITELTPTMVYRGSLPAINVFIRHVYRWFNHFLHRNLIKMTSMTSLLSVVDHFNEHSKSFFIICFGMFAKLR